MTISREELNDLILTMRAYLEGKEIECAPAKFTFENVWQPVPEPSWDVINYKYRVKKEKQTGWLVIYKGLDGSILPGLCIEKVKERALAISSIGFAIACIQITWEEGEGL